MEHISSRQHAVLRRMRELARRGSSAGEVLLDGAHLLEEACSSRVPVEAAVFASDAASGHASALLERVAAAGARVLTAAPAALSSVSPVNSPTGVLAIARPARWTLDEAMDRRPQLLLMLDHVQDPGNVGAIIRAAEACGATGVVTSGGTADPYGWKALRGAMGSTFRLPVAAAPSLGHAIEKARAAGVRIFAAVPRGGTRLGEARLDRPAAIVLGAEGAGLTAEVLEAADEHLMIEMRPPVESLNVAVAAALMVYEASRQRTNVAVR